MSSKNRTWLIIALIAIGFCLILAAVLLNTDYYQQLSDKLSSIISRDNSSADLSAAAPTSSNPEDYQISLGVVPGSQSQTAPADPTANWLAYSVAAASTTASSSNVLYSFKYPPVFKVQKDKRNVTLSSDQATSTQIAVYLTDSKKSLVDYIKEVDQLNAKSWEGKPAVSVVTSTDKVTVAGAPAIFREQILLAADLSAYIIYFKIKDVVYAITLRAPALDQNLLAAFALFANNFQIGK